MADLVNIVINGKDNSKAAFAAAGKNAADLNKTFSSTGMLANRAAGSLSSFGLVAAGGMAAAVGEAASSVAAIGTAATASTGGLIALGIAGAVAGVAIGNALGESFGAKQKQQADATITLLNTTIQAVQRRIDLTVPELASINQITRAYDLQREAILSSKSGNPLAMADALIQTEKTQELEIFKLRSDNIKKLQELQANSNEKYIEAQKAIADFDRRQADEKFKKYIQGLDDEIKVAGDAKIEANRQESDAYNLERDLKRDAELEGVEGLNRVKMQNDFAYQDRMRQISDLNLSENDSIKMVEIANEEAGKKRKGLNKSIVSATVSGASDMFGNLATAAQAFGKKGAKAAKVFAIGKALMDTYTAANGAYAALASIPYVGPALGIAAAAAALAAGMANVSMIKGQQAHGGLDFVPAESTFLLSRGERVVQPKQNEALTEFLDAGQRGGGGGATHVVVNLDGYMLFKAFGQASRDGRLELSSKAIV